MNSPLHHPEHRVASHISEGQRGGRETNREVISCTILSAATHAALTALQRGQSLGFALDTALEIDAKFHFESCCQQWLQHAIWGAIQLPVTT
jgi:hypothetical protein